MLPRVQLNANGYPSNALPFSGEGRNGWSIVALPGPRGGHASFDEPRGPGSLTLDRELAAFIRCNGLLDSWRPDLQRFARTDSLPTTTPASVVRESRTGWHEFRQRTGRWFTDRLRPRASGEPPTYDDLAFTA